MKRKLKKFLKIIPVAILLLIIIILGINKLVYTKYDNLSDTDKNMLNELSEIYRTYNNKSEDIWKKDYTFDNIPLIVTPVSKDKGIMHTYSYAIGVDKFKKSIFSKRIETPKEMNLPQVYRVSCIAPSLFKIWMPINFDFSNLRKQHVAFFKYNTDSIKKRNINNVFKYFLMHEVFHEYRQVPIWKNINKLKSSIHVEERNKEQYQLLLIEFAILDKACSANNKDEMVNVLNDFVTVRDFRYNKFNYMKQEKLVETLEGCAEYIEYKYSNVVKDSAKQYRKFSDAFNTKALENFTIKYTLNGFMDKNIYYYVGALQGMFLDKLQSNWKDKVENNELVYDILRNEIRKQVGKNKKSLDDIKVQYGYNKFYDQAQIIVNNFK
ncbi:hypothetical protein Z967_10650 [Clostridium novyi A str. 4540]|uniref:hypothetical protein n=1 Tax=Clostridium novyi TaxID=1542 RepID=UPI0004D6F38C|nr:hypothetical protein [Clostridium novyi]KEH89312.1 hypothetical protein Z967_10650 [Clostridium novyi A str. 4540]